jgi:hypothetical protein
VARTPLCHPAPNPASISSEAWISTRRQMIFAACACAGASMFLYAVDPNRHAVYPQCLLYKTTGLYCAGCGATRALHALLHGRFLEALHDNALFIAALPVGFWLAVPYLMQAWQADAWPQVRMKGKSLIRAAMAALIAMLVFMALRNLPGWPFDLIKPLVPEITGN